MWFFCADKCDSFNEISKILVLLCASMFLVWKPRNNFEVTTHGATYSLIKKTNSYPDFTIAQVI